MRLHLPIILAATLLAAGAAGAKPYVEYSPTKGVWEVNQVEVDPNHIDDYLVGLRRTQTPGFEVMKRRGMVDDYKFLVRNGFTKGTASVVIMIHYTSLAALTPDKVRDEAIDKELLATLSDADAKVAVAGYEKYRSFLDDAYYTEMTIAK